MREQKQKISCKAKTFLECFAESQMENDFWIFKMNPYHDPKNGRFTDRPGYLANPYIRIVADFNYDDDALIEKTFRQFEVETVGKSTESALVVTKKNQLLWIQGDRISINAIEDIGSDLIGAKMTHFHPHIVPPDPQPVTNFSFSAEDLTMFFVYQMHTMWGFDKDYRYVLKWTKDTVVADYTTIKRDFKNLENELRFHWRKRDGKKEVNAYHRVNLEFQQRYKHYYRRTKAKHS